MLKYPFLGGIFLPLKIFDRASIVIRSKNINLKGRLTIGNRKKSAVVSVLPINIFIGKSSIINFGESVCIGPGVNIIVKENAEFSVGSGTYFTSDMHIEAVKSISIGDNCAISWGVTIIDDDHHRIEYVGVEKVTKNCGVEIGNKVWIGCNVTILKGCKIGDGSVIGAGSIVSGIFPPDSLIVGNPARIVKSDIKWI
jgi:acetyltransferase-like isoleucine patch superfamily enzyme